MEIELSVIAGPDGRLSGSLRQTGGDVVIPFSGTLELIAGVQDLCTADPATPPLAQKDV